MGAIKIHHTPTQEGVWNGPANEKKLRSGESESYYSRMYAYRDPGGDSETKAAYKFPHHFVGDDGEPGAASIKGCQTGIGVLNGSMGGADISEGDRRGVYRHLAAHLNDADVEPAELSARSGGGSVERRYLPVEVRVVEEADGPHIRGYGAVFGEPSDDLGGFREIIERGAFTKTLTEADVRSLWNHNALYVLGRIGAGTLTLRQGERGLFYDATPPDTQWARDLMVSIRRGDVDQASFGFRTIRDRWVQDNEGNVTRTLLEVALFDVGPVTFPAYPQTSAEARARALDFIPLLDDGDGDGAPGQAPHPPGDEATQARTRLTMLRRRVDLAETE